MKYLIIFVPLLLLFAPELQAGTVTGGLAERFDRANGEALPVLITLESRLQAGALQEQLRGARLPLADVHARIMDSLQARARASQPGVVRVLDALTLQGAAADVKTFWVANIIAARLTRSAADQIANLAEVREVGLDEEVVMHAPLNISRANAPQAIASHLERTRARDAWEMGFRGDNRTVCILADGVNGKHAALSDRWRGRVATPEQSWMGGLQPAACGDQGTLMAGLVCGDRTGVAPGAGWIGAQAVCGPVRLSDMIAALQWSADPDGDARTFGDVPDAICCAWSMTTACTGSAPSTVWEAADNVETMGPVVVFTLETSGREGMGTVTAPASRRGNFAVGAADAGAATVIAHPASARGPSPCDGSVKPDMVAPGTAVLSTAQDGYALVTGSAAAAAQVAGTVALMRQANGTLFAQDIKRILSLSATDLGPPNEDNHTGHGLLDVRAAVELAQGARGSGGIRGVVSYGSQPVAGARVVLAGEYGKITTVTNANGAFQFDHLATDRPYHISVGRFGFQPYVRQQELFARERIPTEVTVNLKRGFRDDAERDQGWSFGVDGDNATAGIWERAIPSGTRAGGRLVEPAEDASPEGQFCFVTAAASSPDADPNASDVDGGRTTLRSPLFDLTEVGEPLLQFAYHYSNDLGSGRGSDFFRAQISSDGGVTWTNLINTATSTNGWKPVSLKLTDFVTPTKRMLLQFIAEDAGPGSLVEAAVDDIIITGTPAVPEPPRDLLLSVQFEHVILMWKPSPEAVMYRVYLSNQADDVVKPANLFTTTSDTTLTVPLSDIPYGEFYFSVTAAR